MEAIVLTEKAATALSFLQGQSSAITGAAVADATGLNPQGVHGVLNSLVKKGLTSQTFNDNLNNRLRGNCDNEETIQALETIAD
jgi:predicted ArsR family transcriptional regulator